MAKRALFGAAVVFMPMDELATLTCAYMQQISNGFKVTSKRWKVLLFAVGAVIGNVGQVVLLDLFISSFSNYNNSCEKTDSTTGPYFVLLFCSILFNIGFWPVVAVKHFAGRTSIGITPETWEYTMSKRHWKLILIGVFDALNGYMMVYSSPPSRVPSDLQPILLQTIIPMTIVLSYFILRKRYVAWQLVGAALVVAAVSVSLVPTFINMATVDKSVRFQEGEHFNMHELTH